MELKLCEECRDYYGFTLQKGFLYGVNDEGEYIASSGWCEYNATENETEIFVYTKTEDGWNGDWFSLRDFQIEDGFFANFEEVHKNYCDACKEIASECEQEGYPSNGSNYELQAENKLEYLFSKYPGYAEWYFNSARQ